MVATVLPSCCSRGHARDPVSSKSVLGAWRLKLACAACAVHLLTALPTAPPSTGQDEQKGREMC